MSSATRRTLPLAALAAALLALVCAAGASAEPAPFGHSCTPAGGVRFCPTTDLAGRVPSFDGTPLDVDVTLPAQGDGPFPAILLLHGLGGTKTAFEGTGDPRYDATYFAQHGYAVVTPTARGFGDSCGVPASRAAGCEHGWTRLGDMRYEVRDLQYLTGLLVDEGVVRPDAIGATGVSYGGGFSTMLAFLHDRVRLPDGGYAPWRSPRGTPISLTAAWPRWLWSNGESIFTRNGRAPWSRTPTGVEAQAYANGIFAVALSGFVAPPGGDLSTDLTRWKQELDRGVLDASVQPTLDNAYRYHGVAGMVNAHPAPLLLQSGWTDALFPVGQSLGAYDAIRRADRHAPVALQLGDLGHTPGANHPQDTASFDRQGLAFFDAWLKRSGGAKPAPGAVTAFTSSCPATAPSGGRRYRAASFGALARGTLRLRTRGTLRIASTGASATLAGALNPLTSGAGPCAEHPVDRTSHATLSAVSRGVTLLGQPVVTGRVATTGRFGQVDARLWDLDPRTQRQRLITRGAYRLDVRQHGRFRFVLDGDGWRFPAHHRIVLELVGRDAPTYGPSPEPFRATLTQVRAALPIRERGPRHGRRGRRGARR